MTTREQDGGQGASLTARETELLEALRDLENWARQCVELLEHDGYKTTALGLQVRCRTASAAIAKATSVSPRSTEGN